MTQDLIDKYISDINELGFEKALTLDSHDVAKILKVQTSVKRSAKLGS